MLTVASKLKNKEFYLRLNSIADPTDAVANNVNYDQRCWVYAQREACGKEESDDVQHIDDAGRGISDVFIINMVKLQ